MDRLVQLFIQSMQDDPESGASKALAAGGRPDAQAIERGMKSVEALLTSQQAAAAGGAPAPTLVCLAMALEEKPHLEEAAIRIYERALQLMPPSKGSWERTVVLEQVGKVCLRQKRYQDAERLLSECAAECDQAVGHPRDAVLFDGAFSTGQTRREFAITVEKLRCKLYHDMGNDVEMRRHWAEVQRLEAAPPADAVERAASASKKGNASSTENESAGGGVKELWATDPKEERIITEYNFMDEGATVLVIIDLNQHLGIGEEASAAVDSLRQFRVKCEKESVDVQLRLRRNDGSVWQFRALLEPLVNEIIPEDTVPRLRGKEGKKRLELKLFKLEKGVAWRGDLVSSSKKAKATTSKSLPAKGTALNPLTAEEIAKLPTPGAGASADNRPSGWRDQISTSTPSPAPGSGCAAPVRPVPVSPVGNDPVAKVRETSFPAWVARVERRAAADAFEVLVHVAGGAESGIGMADLELDIDAQAAVQLRLRADSSAAGAGDVLELTPPDGAAKGAPPAARWRKKIGVLELRFPLS